MDDKAYKRIKAAAGEYESVKGEIAKVEKSIAALKKIKELKLPVRQAIVFGYIPEQVDEDLKQWLTVQLQVYANGLKKKLEDIDE